MDEDAFDPLRDGPLRFLGYSNEVGEAFAAWLPPGGVPASYALAISYVLVDTYDKGVKAYRRASRELNARNDLDASIDKEGYVYLCVVVARMLPHQAGTFDLRRAGSGHGGVAAHCLGGRTRVHDPHHRGAHAGGTDRCRVDGRRAAGRASACVVTVGVVDSCLT